MNIKEIVAIIGYIVAVISLFVVFFLLGNNSIAYLEINGNKYFETMSIEDLEDNGLSLSDDVVSSFNSILLSELESDNNSTNIFVEYKGYEVLSIFAQKDFRGINDFSISGEVNLSSTREEVEKKFSKLGLSKVEGCNDNFVEYVLDDNDNVHVVVQYINDDIKSIRYIFNKNISVINKEIARN